VWGLDNVRPLRKAPRGYTHLLVAIDKFSKWVEVRPITNLRAKQAVAFFTDIIYRFGVPNSIITNNGSEFTNRKFLEFYDKHYIRVDWAAVVHPRTNGEVERANGMILQGLKARIFDRLSKSGRKWLQELPAVMWSLRTTSSRATGFTPFFLVYGAEAILPTDLEYRSPRVKSYDEGTNQRATGPIGRGPHCGPDAFSKIPAGSEAVPGPEDTALRFRRRGPSPKAAPRQSRLPQAIAPMGGTLHHC
jgi:hypothetical protein